MKILVYGSKDFGRLVRQLVRSIGHDFVGFIDDFSAGADIIGPYEVARAQHPPAPDSAVVIAIGYEHLKGRWAVYERVMGDGYTVPSLVHPAALVHPDARIGDGAIVMADANIDVFTEVGPLTVVWPGAIVSHDCRVGSNNFLSPGAILCGFVTTGTACFIGAGAVVVDKRTLPDGAFIKAAALYK